MLPPQLLEDVFLHINMKIRAENEMDECFMFWSIGVCSKEQMSVFMWFEVCSNGEIIRRFH